MDLIIHQHYLHSLIDDMKLVFYDDKKPSQCCFEYEWMLFCHHGITTSHVLAYG